MAKAVSAIPTEGDAAPLFDLPSGEGATVKLRDFKGKPVVIYFYPKDNTPGCTIEAKGFRDSLPEFEKLGVTILGISPDDSKSHCSFTDQFDLNFPLLSDTEHAVAKKYGLWVEKNMYGRTYWGVQRATFLVDQTGKVAKAWPKVKPDGHAAEVLEAVRTLK